MERLHVSRWERRLAAGLARHRWPMLAGVLVVGLAVLLLTTVGGKGRPPGKHVGALDVVYYYVGGSCYREGINPYDYERFTGWARANVWDNPHVDSSTRAVQTGYAYPPTAAVPFWGLAHLSFNGARLAWLAMNWVSLGVVAVVMAWGVRAGQLAQGAWGDKPWAWATPVLVTAFTLMNPFTSHNMWMGQSSLIALALLCGAWWAKDKDRWVLCGLLTALATAKISMSVFFVLSLLVERRWRAFFACCAWCALLASIPLVREGPVGTVLTWFDGMKQYLQGRPGDLANSENFGVKNLAAAWLGVRVPAPEVIGLALFALCAWKRWAFTSLEFFAVGLALAALFVKGNDYDLVLLIPMLAACLMAAGGSLVWTVLIALAFAAMAFPKRVYTEKLGTPSLLRARELVLLVVTVGVIVRGLVWKRTK
jgi:hypothetical protein